MMGLRLQFLGTSRNDPAMRAGADYLLTQLPEIKQVHTSYYWYYGMQGDYWQEWNTALRDMVVETQIKDGHMAERQQKCDWEKNGNDVHDLRLRHGCGQRASALSSAKRLRISASRTA